MIAEEEKIQLMNGSDMTTICGGLIVAPIVIGEIVIGVIAGIIGE